MKEWVRKTIWEADEVDLWSKYLIYMAFPISLLLWVFESWH